MKERSEFIEGLRDCMRGAGIIVGSGLLLAAPCYAGKALIACGIMDAEQEHAMRLEDKCDDLNREKPMLEFLGHRYTLQCDKEGNPVLYEQ